MKNKALMSLVLASISAMAAVPFIIEQQNSNNSNESKDDKNLINLSSSPPLSNEEKDNFIRQLDAMMMKKTSIQYLSENVNILADNYAQNNQSMKSQIFKELNLAQTADSTTSYSKVTSPLRNINGAGSSVPVVFCHNACHGACHVACHGARGWR